MILVFVGAGGSTAVDPEQYPTTKVFFERLPHEIKKNALFSHIHTFLQSKKKGGEIDIEDILEALGELQETSKKIGDPNSIVGKAMQGQLGPINGYQEFNTCQNSMAVWGENEIAPLKDRINEQVYAFYGTRPDPTKLSVWRRLLKGLKEIDPAIEIFTTNYDFVLEDATMQAELPMEYGAVHDLLEACVDYTLWNPSSRSSLNDRGLLTKLHGSVNWQYFDGKILRGAPYPTGNHQNHCILYPGYKGVPTEEPFRTFHEHLRRVVRGQYGSLTAAIFIGFAFRDDYINSILDDLLSETPKYVITKSDGKHIDDKPPENAPASLGDNCLHNREGLTAETIKSCLTNITAWKAGYSE